MTGTSMAGIASKEQQALEYLLLVHPNTGVALEQPDG